MAYTEDLTSLVDGSRTVFQTELPFVVGTAHVYLDGIRMALGDDYEETAVGPDEAAVGTGIVMSEAVPLGSSLVIIYGVVADGVISASGT